MLIPRPPLGSRSSSSAALSSASCYYEKNSVECPAGALGLILDSKRGTGVFIYAIRSYSPLRSIVSKGDVIIEIDGKDVTSMGTSEVTKIMAHNSSGRRVLTILSKVEKVQGSNAVMISSEDEEFDV